MLPNDLQIFLLDFLYERQLMLNYNYHLNSNRIMKKKQKTNEIFY